MCKIIDMFRLYEVSPNFASIVPALQNLHILGPSSVLAFRAIPASRFTAALRPFHGGFTAALIPLHSRFKAVWQPL